MQKMVSLRKIQKAGGPPPRTTKKRLYAGRYPDAVLDGFWKIPLETAVTIVTEWEVRKDWVSAASLARECGLKDTSLNPRVINGDIAGTNVSGKWFISPCEVEKVKNYYVGAVTTSKAAELMGFSHRGTVLNMINHGFPALKIGTKHRVRYSDIELYLAGKLTSFDRVKGLTVLSDKLGFKLDWRHWKLEVSKRIFYKTLLPEESQPIVLVFCQDRFLFSMLVSTLKNVFGKYVYYSNNLSEWNGEIKLLLHPFVEMLFDNHLKDGMICWSEAESDKYFREQVLQEIS